MHPHVHVSPWPLPMTKLVIAIVIVAALLIGGLMQLLRTRRQPMGSPQVLARAQQRERDLEEQERRERES
jgi:hypothetical protein